MNGKVVSDTEVEPVITSLQWYLSGLLVSGRKLKLMCWRLEKWARVEDVSDFDKGQIVMASPKWQVWWGVPGL